MALRLEINPFGPQPRKIEAALEVLREDGVILFPTGTTYVFGCSIHSKKAMSRIYLLKEIDKKKPLTFVCSNASQIEAYTRGIPTPLFRRMKSHLPGPYCFILEASKLVPKVFQCPKSTIGVKMPENLICQALVTAMGEPILTSSVPLAEGETMLEGGLLFDQWRNQVDCVIDGGEIYITQSAVIDCTGPEPFILREGDADLSWLE